MRFAIFNADDFGYSGGINRGILEVHQRGVLTSASLMVNTPATGEAVRMAADAPRLSVGLHVNFTNEGDRLVDSDDPAACAAELRRQFDRFIELMGRLPTHLDSHQHVHRERPALDAFRALADEHRLPLREFGPVTYVGGFYAQWEHGVSQPEHVSVDALAAILRHEVPHGVTEIACHPGYRDAAFRSVYDADRAWEIATLCDPRVRDLLAEQSIERISYTELPRALASLQGGQREAETA